MRIAFLTLVLAISVTATSFTKSNPLDSIRPLSISMKSEDGEQMRMVICTAWATRDAQGLNVWVTAAHCAFNGTGPRDGMQVDGHPVSLRFANLETDVAVLVGGPRATLFLLAFREPDVFEPLWTAGYPHGSTSLHATVGVFSSSHDDQDNVSLYSLPVANGMSGSPVVETKSGLVVGMVTQSECHRWCPLSRGTNVMKIRAALEYR